jgi:hypothetical protein
VRHEKISAEGTPRNGKDRSFSPEVDEPRRICVEAHEKCAHENQVNRKARQRDPNSRAVHRVIMPPPAGRAGTFAHGGRKAVKSGRVH